MCTFHTTSVGKQVICTCVFYSFTDFTHPTFDLPILHIMFIASQIFLQGLHSCVIPAIALFR